MRWGARSRSQAPSVACPRKRRIAPRDTPCNIACAAIRNRAAILGDRLAKERGCGGNRTGSSSGAAAAAVDDPGVPAPGSSSACSALGPMLAHCGRDNIPGSKQGLASVVGMPPCFAFPARLDFPAQHASSLERAAATLTGLVLQANPRLE